MSDAVLVALIAAVGSVVAAVVSGFALLQGRRNGTAVHETHLLINSRMTELLRLAAQAAHAEGKAEGEQNQRDRQAPAVSDMP